MCLIFFYAAFKSVALKKTDLTQQNTWAFCATNRAAGLKHDVSVVFAGVLGLLTGELLWREEKQASCKQKQRVRAVSAGRSSPAVSLWMLIRE